jgi:hypothetical protein
MKKEGEKRIGFYTYKKFKLNKCKKGEKEFVVFKERETPIQNFFLKELDSLFNIIEIDKQRYTLNLQTIYYALLRFNYNLP